MYPTEAVIALRNAGATIKDSKTSEYVNIITLANGISHEVWDRDIVAFAKAHTD